MPIFLMGILQWVIVSSIARVLAGVTLAVVAQTFLADYATDALASMLYSIQSMPSVALQLMLLSGIGQVITILGSALITRTTIVMAAKTFGIGID